jgi:hypothetical protein
VAYICIAEKGGGNLRQVEPKWIAKSPYGIPKLRVQFTILSTTRRISLFIKDLKMDYLLKYKVIFY